MNQPKTEPAQASVTGCVYIGAPTGQTLPCKSSCPKCGSTDIFRKHLDGGEEALQLLCSAHEIASREGVNTNWKAFLSSVKQVLKKCNRTGVTARTYRLYGEKP